MSAPAPGLVEVRTEARPRWPLRLPPGGMDGIMRRRGGVRERLLHIGDEAAIVRAAQPSQDRVVIGAWSRRRDVAEAALERMRFAIGVDDDLAPFYERFRDDPLIGPSVRRDPGLRAIRRLEPFEALVCAVTEQLIEFERAVQIQRRIIRRHGRACPHGTPLRDAPSAAVVAGLAPAQLEAMDLSAGRSLALIRAAREVASGRVDLHAADHERGWQRLLAIPGIGPWTVEILAIAGQGRYDQLPAGDLAYVKLVGRALAGGDPRARAEVDEVRAFFAGYDGWAGLAGMHALRCAAHVVTVSSLRRRSPARPAPAGTRSSAPPRTWAA